MRKILSNRKWGILLLSASFLFLVFNAVYPVLAVPPGTTYTPGETLDPSCAPGDPNCTVTTPLTANNIGDYGVASLSGGSGFIVSNATGTVVLSLDVDSTLATSTQLGLNLNNANTWLAVQTFSASTTMASTSITYLTSGNVNITGGSLSGVTGNISMWTNDSNYLTTSTEADQVWLAASTSYANLSLSNTFTGTTNTFSNAIFNGNVSFLNGIKDNATTSVLSISSGDRALYAEDGVTPVLQWGLNNSLVWGNSAGVNQSDAVSGHSTGYSAPHEQILGNIFIGNYAGNAVTDGNEGDVFIGNNAGQLANGSPQVPAENTYVGHMSGGLNTTGFYNAYLGGRAGRANTTGYANTFLGWAAGEYGTTTNNNYQTYVGVEAARWGGGNSNTTVGARSGFSTIQDHGGLGSYNTMVGVYTGQSSNDAGPWAAINGTTLVGYKAGSMDQRDGLTAIGYQAGLNNTTGDLNTFLGYNAGTANTTGSNNTLLGYNAGLSNVTGNSITAIGAYTDEHDTIGGGVYVGYLTAFTNVTGTSNVYVGNRAGRYANSSNGTFIGDYAGTQNTSGAGNTFIGKDAGYNNTSGGDNTVIGYGAGSGNVTGSRLVLLGEYAGKSITTNNDLIAIGNYAGNSNTGGNSIYLGYLSGFNNVTGTGNIFIGNSAGRYETGSNKFIVDNQNRTDMNGDETGALLNGTFNATPSLQTLTVNGKVGISTTTPAAFLHVLGTTEQLRLGYNAANYASFTVGTDGALTITPTNSATTTVSSGLVVGGNANFANGTVTAPSLSFTGDTDTGLYWIGSNNLGVTVSGTKILDISPTAVYNSTGVSGLDATDYFQFYDNNRIAFYSNGGVVAQMKNAGFEVNNFLSLNTTVPMTFTSYDNDASDAVAFKYTASTPLTTAGGKLAQWFNGTTSTAYIDYLGSFNAGAGTASLPAYSFAGDPDTGIWRNGTNAIGFVTGGITRGDLDANGLNFDVFRPYNNTSVTLKGRFADGATAVATILDNVVALTTAGGKITSFRTNGSEKAYVDYLGGFFASTGTVSIPAYGFVTDTDTGIYWPSADNLALTTSGTERMRIDSSGNVGIGTTAPASKLDITSSATDTNMLRFSASSTQYASLGLGNASVPVLKASFSGTGGNGGYLDVLQAHTNYGLLVHNGSNWGGVGVDASGNTQFSTNVSSTDFIFYGRNFNDTLMRIKGTGNVGIGTSTPAYKFQVYVDASNEGHVAADGTWGTSSDERLKKNILTLNGGLEKTLALRPVVYDPNTLPEGSATGTMLGFIAQEVQKILPQVVDTNPLTGFMSISYAKFTPILVSAIQDQQAQINKFVKFIGEGFSQLVELIADKITARRELCVGETCVNEAQLKQLLLNANNVSNNFTSQTTVNSESINNSTDNNSQATTGNLDTTSSMPADNNNINIITEEASTTMVSVETLTPVNDSQSSSTDNNATSILPAVNEATDTLTVPAIIPDENPAGNSETPVAEPATNG